MQRVEFKIGAFLPRDFPTDRRAQIAFIGRSNVGKSSLINALTRRHNLARVSQTPGKTRGIFFYLVDERFYLVDLPGYGFAVRAKTERAQWRDLVGAYLEGAVPRRVVVLLVDSRHPAQAADVEMLEWLRSSGIGFVVAMTKADKQSRGKLAVARQAMTRQLALGAGDEPIAVSSTTRDGLDDLASWIRKSIN